MSQLHKLLAMQKAKAGATTAPAPTPTPAVSESAPAKQNPLGLLKRAEAPAAPTKSAVNPDSIGFDLADLAAMDAGSIDATPAREQTTISGYFDEIEATAPDRDLPADLTQQQRLFIESLDGIYQILHDAELFAQSVRNVMIELDENPEYTKLISDHDVHTMIRGMRNSMGMARIKKQEKSRKGGTGRAASKSKGKAASSEALSILDKMMAGMGDDDD
jgi:hypothetical protein